MKGLWEMLFQMYTAPPPPLHSNDETQDKAKPEDDNEKVEEKVSTLKRFTFDVLKTKEINLGECWTNGNEKIWILI